MPRAGRGFMNTIRLPRPFAEAQADFRVCAYRRSRC